MPFAVPIFSEGFGFSNKVPFVGSDSTIISNSPSVPLLHLAGWYAPDGGVSAQQFWSDLVGAAATWRPWRCSSINLLLCKCVYLPSFSLIVLNFSMYNNNTYFEFGQYLEHQPTDFVLLCILAPGEVVTRTYTHWAPCCFEGAFKFYMQPTIS